MSFADILFRHLESMDMEQKELAKKLNVSKQTISAYITGRSTPTYKALVEICKIFNKDANYFMQDDLKDIIPSQIIPEDEFFLEKYHNLTQHDRGIINYILEVGKIGIKEHEQNQINIYHLPVYDQDAAAGIGQLGNDKGYSIEDFTIDNIPKEAVFAMKISGDSMKSTDTNYLIHTGSIVLINPRYEVSDLDNKIVIANFKGEIICKRYIDKVNYVLFQSDNTEYEKENRESDNNSDYQIVGIVLGVIEENKFVKI